MEEAQEQPVKQEECRNPDGTFRKGFSGNIKGRPKGQSLKEYTREYFSKLSDEEKHEFLMGMSKDVIWKQAEGNPATETDITSKGEKIFVLPAELINKNGIRTNISTEVNSTGQPQV
jgi:hypothetical protein